MVMLVDRICHSDREVWKKGRSKDGWEVLLSFSEERVQLQLEDNMHSNSLPSQFESSWHAKPWSRGGRTSDTMRRRPLSLSVAAAQAATASARPAAADTAAAPPARRARVRCRMEVCCTGAPGSAARSRALISATCRRRVPHGSAARGRGGSDSIPTGVRCPISAAGRLSLEPQHERCATNGAQHFHRPQTLCHVSWRHQIRKLPYSVWLPHSHCSYPAAPNTDLSGRKGRGQSIISQPKLRGMQALDASGP